jgi:hypothetical protein
MVADALNEIEASLESPRVEIIEKQSAYATGLPSVLQIEILITPLLETRIDIIAERLACLLGYMMPVYRVLLKPIIWCEVESSSKPPDGR